MKPVRKRKGRTTFLHVNKKLFYKLNQRRYEPCSVGEVVDDKDNCANCCGEDVDNPCDKCAGTGVEEGEDDCELVTKPSDVCL